MIYRATSGSRRPIIGCVKEEDVFLVMFQEESCCVVTRYDRSSTACWGIKLLAILTRTANLDSTSSGGCGRQATAGIHPRDFHYLIFILMVKRILLLALITSRAAPVLCRFLPVFGLGLTSWVGPGKRTTSDVCLSPWIHRSGSQAVGLLPWIGGWGQVILVSLGRNSPVLGDHFTSWDRKPEDPNKSADFAWTPVSRHSGIFEYRV